MKKIGKVIHITSSRKVVVKAENLPKIGDKVVNEKRNPVCEVFDIFGSTSSPYVEIRTEMEDPQELVEHSLYVSTSDTGRMKLKKRKNR